MFESAELGQTLDKSTFKERAPVLREELLDAQFALRESPSSVLLVIAGPEGSGKGDLLHRLLEWMDARGIEAHALRAPSDEERQRPLFWRYWRRLPPRGHVGIFIGSWYVQLMVAHASGELTPAELERGLRRIVEFERLLAHEGTVLLKFYLHVTRDQQRERFEELERSPRDAWRVTRSDWEQHERYDELLASWGEVVRRTDKVEAPWNVVEAMDARHRDVAVAERLLRALRERLEAPPPPEPAAPAPEDLPVPDPVNLLAALDLSKHLDKDEYEERLEALQGRLGALARVLAGTERSLVIVFEGPDAAGKGGAIRRLTRALDARFCKVTSISAPTPEERAHPYPWRFWRRLPRHGEVAVFDRSWYGRVLVERIEGYCTPEAWRRAYGEINGFEEQLVDDGVVVVKLWLAIDADEQARRFEDRERTGFKRYKITDEDRRNRSKWSAYEAAACEMFEHTSTTYAPWTLVEANDKRFARVKVLETICERLEAAVGGAEGAD